MAAPTGRTPISNLPFPTPDDDVDVPRDIKALSDALDPMLVGLNFIGAEIFWAGTGDPPGGYWLLEDGRLLDIATYPTFAALIGHAYNNGVDPGGGKFKIPDARGRVKTGVDNMGTAAGAAGRNPDTNIRGQAGGSSSVLLTAAQSGMRSHTHIYLLPSASNLVTAGPGQVNAGANGTQNTSDASISGASAAATHENRMPFQVSNVIVRVK